MSEERQLYLNGEIIPESKAKISIFDYWPLLGHCVTEATRTFAHKPFKLREHIERLLRSAKAAYVPCIHTVEELMELTELVLTLNLHLIEDDDDYRIDHNFSPGLANRHADPDFRSPGPSLVIYVTPLQFHAWAKDYVDGCHIVTAFKREIPADCIDPKIKHRDRIHYRIMENEVAQVDVQAKPLILDLHGNVAQNTGANVFIVSGGSLHTPTSRNSLAGISKETVIELAKNIGIPVFERDIQPYDVMNADEAFLTSTPYCMLPATKFNFTTIGDGKVGRITKQLLDAWSETVGVDIVQQALSRRLPEGIQTHL